MTHKVLKSIVRGFLGTYTSRYSDAEGYWLFGFLVSELDNLEIDLLQAANPMLPEKWLEAAMLASRRFEEQVKKHGFDALRVREARLTIQKLPGQKAGAVNGRKTVGSDVAFSVAVVSDLERRFEAVTVAFIAPHDPRHELRRVL